MGKRRPKRGRDWARWFARGWCLLMAFIGLMPWTIGLLLRLKPVQTWAATQVRQVLASQLGLDARFRVEFQTLPPRISLRDVAIPEKNGHGQAITIQEIRVQPRPLAWLRGKLEVGDIELVQPRIHGVVSEDGLANVRYRLPKTKPSSEPTKELPFRSLSISDARLHIEVPEQGLTLTVRGLDVDVDATYGPDLRVGFQLEDGVVSRQHADNKALWDDDRVCLLKGKVHVEPEGTMVQRLEAQVRLDDDPKYRGGPSCVGPFDWSKHIGLKLFRFHIKPRKGGIPALRGNVRAELPLTSLKRIGPGAPGLTGSLGVDVDFAFSDPKKLPSLQGRLWGKQIVLNNEYVLARTLEGQVETQGNEVRLPQALVGWSAGLVSLKGAVVKPLVEGIPVYVERADVTNINFPDMMKDLDVTKHTIIDWKLTKGAITNFHGFIIDPVKKGPSMIGDLKVATKDFVVWDRGWDDPTRARIVNVNRATVTGKFGVEPNAIMLTEMLTDFGHSHLDIPKVMIGFHNELDIRVAKPTRVDLGDITPIATVPMGGVMHVRASVLTDGKGPPHIEGQLWGKDYVLGDLPLADEVSGKVDFLPNILEFRKLKARKGSSRFVVPAVRLDFERPKGMLVDAEVYAPNGSVRDVLSMFRFEKDPRFTDIAGRGQVRASVRYDSGGPLDRCKTGLITVRAQAKLGKLDLFGETYDSAKVDLDYRWFDRDAQERGVEAVIHSALLRKGSGFLLGSGVIQPGGGIRAHFHGNGVPLSRLDALGPLAKQLSGEVRADGEVSGTLDRLRVDTDVSITPVRIGRRSLPPSKLHVTLEPNPAPRKQSGKLSTCGIPIAPPFDLAEFKQDKPDGEFVISGKLFGGQLALNGFRVTRQRSKIGRGTIGFNALDLGVFAQLVPSIVTSDAPPTGKLSGSLRLARLPLDAPTYGRGQLTLTQVQLRKGGRGLSLHRRPGMAPKPLVARFGGQQVELTPLTLDLRSLDGFSGSVELGGKVSNLGGDKKLDLNVHVPPLSLASLASAVPGGASVGGELEANLHLGGTLSRPLPTGQVNLRKAKFEGANSPIGLSDVDLTAVLEPGMLRVDGARGKAGGGDVVLQVRLPLKGLRPGTLRAKLNATNVAVAARDGVDLKVNANLEAEWSPPSDQSAKSKPALIRGDIGITHFLYTRPITFTVDFDSLAKKGRRTKVQAYEPEEDSVRFQIFVRPLVPLRFRNNLIDAAVALDSSALYLTGTNQRFGLTGQLRVEKGGRLRLRANEFEIQQGTIRFQDPTRIAPRVNIRATTEYVRYTSSAGGAAASGAAAGAGSGSAGGAWRIAMHAYGDADNLKLDLTSEPRLAQEDIVLLLTAGMTRAELDQLQASNLGSTAALEALSALSGADQAVRTVIPIIDDFRFGTAYSTRTGRTEPTVTVGKRISKRIRANITSGLSENRDIRSNVEWKLTPQTSVLGNYDNLNDVTSQGLGNLGTDFRIRLEF